MIDGSLWARSVAIPLHWEASKDEQLHPPGGANKAKITLNYFSFSKEKSPERQTHARKRRNKERKIERKKERNSIHRYRRVFLPERRDRPKLYRKTYTENEKMNFFQVSLYRKLFFDSH